MNPQDLIFHRRYLSERPFVNVKISVINLKTNKISTFEQDCWIDTGFSGGVHVPEFRRSDVQLVDVTPRLTAITLAGGVRARAYVCLAYLQQIESLVLPSPGIEVELIMQGRLNYGLLGLNVLRRWIVKFNGPQQVLGFYKAH